MAFGEAVRHVPGAGIGLRHAGNVIAQLGSGQGFSQISCKGVGVGLMVSGMTNATGTLRATVAGEVRAMMARRRITQTDLANKLGWTQSYVSRRLSGDVPFDIDELEVLADLFDVPVVRFLETAWSRGTAKSDIGGRLRHPTGLASLDAEVVPGAEEQEAVEEHLLSRAELLSILPPVPALAAEQRRVLEAANGGALAMTDLEWKLRVAGAEEQTIARAQERRSVTSVRLAERPILDGDVDDELVGLEGRALEHADAVTADVVGSAAGSAQAGRPAEVIYGRLVQQTGQLGALDSDGVLDGDGGLVLGLVCELSDRCLFEWRSA